MTNLFDATGEQLRGEQVDELLKRSVIRVERIVSRGHASPDGFWYDQDESEWVVVLRGSACLRFEGERELRELKPGDHVDIPAHCRHRVERTDPDCDTIWLAIFYRD